MLTTLHPTYKITLEIQGPAQVNQQADYRSSRNQD